MTTTFVPPNQVASHDDNPFADLHLIEPEPRGFRGASYRFSEAAVKAVYGAIRRGLSWRQINEHLGEAKYARHESLAQTIHSAARHYGIEAPNPNRMGPKGPRKPKN
jgi:hypothetical protein